MSFIKHTKKFTTTPNEIINNKNLSFKAKGIWLFLNSKPTGWDFSIARIALQSKEGEDSVRAGLTELREQGYLDYTPKRDPETGRMIGQEYHFFDEPQGRDTEARVFRPTENGGYISKREDSKKEYSKREEREPANFENLIEKEPEEKQPQNFDENLEPQKPVEKIDPPQENFSQPTFENLKDRLNQSPYLENLLQKGLSKTQIDDLALKIFTKFGKLELADQINKALSWSLHEFKLPPNTGQNKPQSYNNSFQNQAQSPNQNPNLVEIVPTEYDSEVEMWEEIRKLKEEGKEIKKFQVSSTARRIWGEGKSQPPPIPKDKIPIPACLVHKLDPRHTANLAMEVNSK